MRDTLDEMVCVRSVPVLGICVGMQILAASSEEGKLPGSVGSMETCASSMSQVSPQRNTPAAHGLERREAGRPVRAFRRPRERCALLLPSFLLFSLRARPTNVLAQAEVRHDVRLRGGSDDIFGVQFHPEKSHHYGTRLLQNFAEASMLRRESSPVYCVRDSGLVKTVDSPNRCTLATRSTPSRSSTRRRSTS